MQHYLVPIHTTGTETDISCSVGTESAEEAGYMFVEAKDRLLNIGKWANYAGFEEISFLLTDARSNVVRRTARRTDHIHILTGLEKTDRDAYVIDALEYDDYPDYNRETFALRLHPTGGDAENDTATIVIERRRDALMAIYHARNHAGSEGMLWHGLSAAAWSQLMQSLLTCAYV